MLDALQPRVDIGQRKLRFQLGTAIPKRLLAARQSRTLLFAGHASPRLEIVTPQIGIVVLAHVTVQAQSYHVSRRRRQPRTREREDALAIAQLSGLTKIEV